jgi:transcriptional regulator with XRE-family HTH domain
MKSAKKKATRLPENPVSDPMKGAEGSNIVGSSIQALRRHRGITLAELANATGHDKGYLSRVEGGQKSPSIATLMRIADALNVQVGHLFGEAALDEAIRVVRHDEVKPVTSGDERATIVFPLMPPNGHRKLSVYLMNPGLGRDHHKAEHPGDEMLYVLEGVVEAVFPQRTIKLEKGDSVMFDGNLQHYFRRASVEALVLVAIAQDGAQLPKSSQSKS